VGLGTNIYWRLKGHAKSKKLVWNTASLFIIGEKNLKYLRDLETAIVRIAKPKGSDPGLTRLRPPRAQEARLLTSAEESAFQERPTNVPCTSWAYQNAKLGRMFVVNRGHKFGFLRCGCGSSVALKDPVRHKAEIIRDGHKTPYNQLCTLKPANTEDFAHEFRTDVLQIRIDEKIPIPKDVRVEELGTWLDAFSRTISRTISEAIRISAARLLGIDQREISATVRRRP